MSEELTNAQTYIGKFVFNENLYTKTKCIDPYFISDIGLFVSPLAPSTDASYSVKEFYEKHGYVIVLNSESACAAFPYAENIKICNTVTLSCGIVLIDHGDRWQSGRTAISKLFISQMEVIFDTKYHGNTDMLNKITVGDIEISREDLSKLNQYSL